MSTQKLIGAYLRDYDYSMSQIHERFLVELGHLGAEATHLASERPSASPSPGAMISTMKSYMETLLQIAADYEQAASAREALRRLSTTTGLEAPERIGCAPC